MPLSTAPPMSRRPLEQSAVIAAWLVLVIGALALFGWVARLPFLTRLLPEWSSMRISTALSFILSGAALVELLGPGVSRSRDRAARFAALVVAGAGLWAFGEYLLGSPPWLESWLVQAMAHSEAPPGRTSPVTTFCFGLIGLSVGGLRGLGALPWVRRASQAAALLVALTAMLVLIVYAYGNIALHTVAPLSSMAAPSALGFLLLSVAVLFGWGKRGPLHVFAGSGLGSVLGRKALPLAIGLPLLAGWLSLNGDRTGLFKVEFAMALVALINTTIFAVLIFAGGLWLNRIDAQRAASEAQLVRSERHFRALAESLPQLVWTCEGSGPCDYLSPQWVQYTGVPENEQLGSAWLNQIHPDDQADTIATWNRAATEGGVFDMEFRIRRHDGVYRWFKTRAEPLLNEKGRIIKWFGCNTDIQDQRDARDKLQQLNQTLERRVEERTEEVRAAHRALQAVTQQLVAAQRLSRVGSWELDVPSGTIQWSAEMFRLLGLRPDNPRPSREELARGFTPEGWVQLEQAFQRCLSTGVSYELELEMMRPDGTQSSIIARGQPSLVTDGKVAQVIGTLQDVTELKRTEHELSRALERVRLATAAANMGIWDWDVRDGALVWDETMSRVYGLRAADFGSAREAWRASVHPEDLPEFERQLDGVLAGSSSFDMSFRIVRPNKQVRHIRGTADVHKGPEGRTLRIVGVNIDVTAQRAAESALRANEALLREFVKHAPAAIAMLDRDVRYLQASDRWLMDYRLDGANIIGRSHYEVFPDIPERWRELHQRVLRGSVEKCDEDPFPRVDGRIEWLQWEARPWRSADGSIGGLIFFTQVITARKEMELELRKRRVELERSNQDLEQFAYVASHDLQEPLRAVAGCGQILKRRYAQDKLEPAAVELIDHMVAGAARMQALILDLLAFSRVGARGPELSPVESGEAVRRAMQQLSGAMSESHAEVDMGTLPRVKGDVDQLTQLFQNLMGNALKYRGRDPVKIQIAAQPSGSSYQFSVSDNGIGIEPQYFDKIFVLFQRLHTREEYPGTGIGLAICKRIVERHGGRIWVESSIGQGSAFHFTLPRGDVNA
jgi:PAS domain S-box-containing protein